MRSIKVDFKNEDGIDLKGIVELPSNEQPHHFVLFAHCFTCNKNYHAPTKISRGLASKGYGVLRFDFTGLGESDGDFADSNFSANVNDLIAASNFLKENYKAPSLLIGHSLGGAAVLFAGKNITSVKAIATINAPSNLSHVQKHFESSLEEIKKNGKASVNIGGRKFQIKQQFVEDLENNNDGLQLKELKKALLILHSPQDQIVSINHAEEIYKAAWHPKSFISLDDADHLLTNDRDSAYVAELISTWVGKYLEKPDLKEPETDHEVMANLGHKGYTTQIIAGNHHFIADEPLSVGGENLGPNPYELVSSGLAACTSMTIQMYARRKKWDIRNVETHVNYAKKHAKDCDECHQKEVKIDHFERLIKIDSDLEREQINRLLEIADRCPVHKTLTTTTEITTTLLE